jgi:hypothetical protein
VFLCATPAFAQIDTGGVTGTVTDSTGAIVAGATVKLVNEATGLSSAGVSTSTGAYAFNAVRPGSYTLQVEAPGFQTTVDKKVQIHIQQTQTIDIRLATGAVTQQVTVTGAAPLLQAENGAVGQTITGQVINSMPLKSRDWASLAQLSAGVVTAPKGQPSSDSGTTDSAFFSVNGVNLWQNDFRLNGINDNIEFYGGSSVGSNAAITPPPDAIQEFRLQTGNFTAEFGHSTGGVVNAAIKSGTNQFHGDAWEYFRNDYLDANTYFNKGKKSEYRRNVFGGTVGGPVRIPGVYDGRDKTFFFGDYQGLREIKPIAAFSTVPTPAMVNSGFTNLQDLINFNGGTGTDVLGRTFPHGTILDPATTRAVTTGQVDPVTGLAASKTGYVRDPFYNGSVAGITNYTGLSSQLNQLPAGRIDPNALKLLGVYPAATSAGLANNFYWEPKQPTNINSYDIRIDEAINSSNVLFGVFDRSLYSVDVPSSLPGLAVGETGGRHDSFPAYAWAVGYTHVFTPTFTNDMHVGMVHSDKLQRSVYGNTFGIPASFGIPGIPQVAENGGIPPINFSSNTSTGLTHIGVGNYTPTLQYVYSIEGSDNVTKVFRGHNFKTGVQVDYLNGNISQPPQGRGNFTFSGQYTDIPNSNQNLNGVADLLLTPTATTVPNGISNVGGLSTYGGSNVAATVDDRWYIGAFFQDDWKVLPNLTLNLGLRWDYFTPYAETNGHQANFIPSNGNSSPGTYYMSKKGCAVTRSASFDALLAQDNIALDCIDSLALGQAQKTNFSPRLGFAYRVRPDLVLRGGYGITYGSLGNLGYGGTLGTNYPFVYTATFNSPDSQHPLQVANGQTATLETAFANINLQDPSIYSGQGVNLYGRQWNFQTPYVQTMNLTMQKQVGNHDSVQVGFVGSVGRHLDNLGYYNSPSVILPTSVNPQNYVPFPNFARNSTYETTNATSSYNSMQATYEHQMSAGLSLLANYTFAKCMSNQHTQASQNTQYRAQWLPGFGINRDYGLCDTDATHAVHLGATYALPVGHGRTLLGNSNGAVDAVLGGWGTYLIYTFQSGQPFTVGCPTSTSNFGCNAFTVPGQDLYSGPHNKTQWLNPAAFSVPPAATAIGQQDFSPLGGGPQQARGPHFNNLDASLFKNFHIYESTGLEFRLEAFNATNTPQFGQPSNVTGFNQYKPGNPGGFAAITSTRNDQRQVQAALKLTF